MKVPPAEADDDALGSILKWSSYCKGSGDVEEALQW
jgi:hypothetical protein